MTLTWRYLKLIERKCGILWCFVPFGCVVWCQLSTNPHDVLILLLIFFFLLPHKYLDTACHVLVLSALALLKMS